MSGLTDGANGMPSYAHSLSLAQRRLLTDYLRGVAWRGRPGGGARFAVSLPLAD